MSSKRGRKRNDTLPPNRARDVQRAFRARRAAHLQALEQRVAELEEENNYLRQALNLPPPNRVPLGKGPTGKDKPKANDATTSGSSSQTPSFASTSRESSTGDTPRSRINSPTPPDSINVSIPSRAMQVSETSSSWNNDMLMNDGHQSDVPDPRTSPYQLAPMTGTLPLKTSYSSYQRDHLPPVPSRGSVSSEMYNGAGYSHSSDRSLSQSDNGQQSYSMRNSDISDEPSPHYSYSSSSFPTYDHHPSLHSQSPSPGLPIIQRQDHSHRDSSLSYPHPHRRCLTDPQGFSLGHGAPRMLYPPSQAQTHHPSSAHQPLLRQGNENGDHTPPPPLPPRYHPYSPENHLDHHI